MPENQFFRKQKTPVCNAPKPKWLCKTTQYNTTHQAVRNIAKTLSLNTICETGRCPNRSECYSNKTMTFMILGDICTRACRFCAVRTVTKKMLQTNSLPINPKEAENIALATQRLKLQYVVLTSVDRDDLPDLGAMHFIRVMQAIQTKNSNTPIEILTPDFQGKRELIQLVLDAHPAVFNHNMETVERLSPKIRRQSDYNLSLKVLQITKELDPSIITKSGLMVGMGETIDEMHQTFRDLATVKCDILTIGHYLPPGKQYWKLQEFIHPQQFVQYAEMARDCGIPCVEAGPFIRSSYRAKESRDTILALRKGK